MSELLASRTKLVIMHTKHWSIEKMNESIEVNEISAKNIGEKYRRKILAKLTPRKTEF